MLPPEGAPSLLLRFSQLQILLHLPSFLADFYDFSESGIGVHTFTPDTCAAIYRPSGEQISDIVDGHRVLSLLPDHNVPLIFFSQNPSVLGDLSGHKLF